MGAVAPDGATEGLLMRRRPDLPRPRRDWNGPPPGGAGQRSAPRGLAGVLAASAVVFALALGPQPAAHAAGATQTTHRLILYSVAEQEQFINHQDDRIRGAGKNPFGNFRDIAPTTKSATGPFPGDVALFSFNLYADSALKRRVGTAQFTCLYNFNKNAFCDATFQLTAGGTLVAGGTFNFNVAAFSLAVTGGDGPYLGVKGTLEEAPSTANAQRLVFTLS